MDDNDFSLQVFIAEDGTPNLLIRAGQHLHIVDGDLDLSPQVRSALAQLMDALYQQQPYLVILDGKDWFGQADEHNPL